MLQRLNKTGATVIHAREVYSFWVVCYWLLARIVARRVSMMAK